MKGFILDTSFIISAIRNKIDFFHELLGEKILIPVEVIQEIQRLKTDEAKIALRILALNQFEQISLGRGHVDKKIIKFAKENPSVIVATLDREIKSKVKNSILLIRGKKKLGII